MLGIGNFFLLKRTFASVWSKIAKKKRERGRERERERERESKRRHRRNLNQHDISKIKLF